VGGVVGDGGGGGGGVVGVSVICRQVNLRE